MDILGEFIQEKCYRTGTVKNSDLYASFSAWQQANGEKPRSHRWLTRALNDRGFKQAAAHANGRRWEGLSLREEETRLREVNRTGSYY